MLPSITIATEGLIERGLWPSLCIASDGLIYAAIKKKRPYDGGGGTYPYDRDWEERAKTGKRILREDEEILEMLKIILPIL